MDHVAQLCGVSFGNLKFLMIQEMKENNRKRGTMQCIYNGTYQFWPSWNFDFVGYNLLIDYKSRTLQCTTILMQFKEKKGPISESDTFVHTTL